MDIRALYFPESQIVHSGVLSITANVLATMGGNVVKKNILILTEANHPGLFLFQYPLLLYTLSPFLKYQQLIDIR